MIIYSFIKILYLISINFIKLDDNTRIKYAELKQ